MPEHNDPIRLLETFGTGGVPVAPLDPEQVRRLGDRRRTRRRAAMIAGAGLAVLVAVGIPVALAPGGDTDGRGDIANTTTPTPTPAATVITYPGIGVSITGPADTAKLDGTTEEFKTFIAGVWRQDAGYGCATPEVTVQKYSSAGYALGGLGCGGYRALWVDHDGQWQEGYGTQDTWDCATLTFLDVPRSFVGDCANEIGAEFGPSTVLGLRLGMTVEQITAAGGSVDPTPGPGCGSLLLPGQQKIAHQDDGAVSPTKGLVGIFARPGMKTPEGIGLGSSRAEVEAAYPSATQKIDYWVVPLGAGQEYQIVIRADGIVTELALAMTAQECFG